MKLDPLKFGLSAGIIWGIGVFMMALIAKETSYGIGFVSALGKIYIGEGPTFLGAILGMIYGFFDAGIGFFVFAWLYNKLAGK
ncbi:hypothetical protein A2276_08345 [candidate division WOR-1 bacterium RIFOXYA12_FULL_43_27]|uniref:Membrane-associated protein n=1 Tax=candidate division WOR-1 bacterium RIFOXYC2_FULL_46_14 TaxID=1802587 RepID=A0A1F4U666_UNCSA|nr:MAG: hypothetical protein A2276_08345 [candidate division WOR-1 bacterium RIFOXYA12_FULL_43_27]OGC20603.1 MAG: hypothetical protein A2292_06170 [candidate division WOR-1 bacterium RIFOXYB2_FULL_46_45]OGC31660.1 MAG: hypothetical protein A2232_05280 [candidate division WOR-1 bacterium RIFOXYA2_FULL_46_56]OGC40444.1 MAG: hypothetical protein A2438_04200 [candidate division WOR-1 bacterium RIFOXYC2_FULL_46_14]